MSFLIFSIILLGIELLYFRIADKLNIIDKPNERSSHTNITLRGGGIIFPIAVLSYFFINGFHDIWFVLGLILIATISFCDDLKPLSLKLRLGVHFLAILLLFYQIQLVQEPFWLICVALILCGGIINAYNFMDGINGITGGYSLVIASALGYVNFRLIPFVDSHFISFVVISFLIFNFFNFRTKAKCFAGDVGSVSSAFIILFMLGLLMLKTRDFSWICFLLVYGIDSVLTIIHRILLGENITKPHRKHLYQLLANELKIPHVCVSGVYMFVQLIVIVGYIAVRPTGYMYSWLYLFVVGSILAIFYVLIKRKWFHLHLPNFQNIMKIINKQLLDAVSTKAKHSPRLRMNYNFHPSPVDTIQRMLNAFEPGTYLRPHRHPDREEVFLVLRGKAMLFIFEDSGKVRERIILSPIDDSYGVEIPPMVWHTLWVIEPNTVIYEFKRGPYQPLTKEHFASWSPEPENSEYVQQYLQMLEKYC
ncbi:MAG: WbuC family cupin fold metalloprotein [Planctomycetaceae bacterium]|jgi:cupin fold WbuC family metalloprotein|nr:WbuC family cupin fold metalloprotein [Planctomycetaceae bacterium]